MAERHSPLGPSSCEAPIHDRDSSRCQVEQHHILFLLLFDYQKWGSLSFHFQAHNSASLALKSTICFLYSYKKFTVRPFKNLGDGGVLQMYFNKMPFLLSQVNNKAARKHVLFSICDVNFHQTQLNNELASIFLKCRQLPLASRNAWISCCPEVMLQILVMSSSMLCTDNHTKDAFDEFLSSQSKVHHGGLVGHFYYALLINLKQSVKCWVDDTCH